MCPAFFLELGLHARWKKAHVHCRAVLSLTTRTTRCTPCEFSREPVPRAFLLRAPSLQRMGSTWEKVMDMRGQALEVGRAVFQAWLKAYREGADKPWHGVTEEQRKSILKYLAGCARGGKADFVDEESRQAMATKVVERYPNDYTMDTVVELTRHQMLGEAHSVARMALAPSLMSRCNHLATAHVASRCCRSRPRIVFGAGILGGKGDFVSIQSKQAMITSLVYAQPWRDPEELWQYGKMQLAGMFNTASFKNDESKQQAIASCAATNPALEPSALQEKTKMAIIQAHGFVRLLHLILFRLSGSTIAAPRAFMLWC